MQDSTWNRLDLGKARPELLASVLDTLNQRRDAAGPDRALVARLKKAIEESWLTLPVLSSSMKDLLKVMASPDPDMDELTSAIERDVGLSIKIVGIANSAYFAAASTITDVPNAVMRLGNREACHIAATAAVSSAVLNVPGYEPEALLCWEHCVLTAAAAKTLCRDDPHWSGMAYLSGLVHDVGRMVLYQYLVDLRDRRLSRGKGKKIALGLVEDFHAPIGALTLEAWDFWHEITEATRCHHCHEEARGEAIGLAAVLRSADLIAHRISGDSPSSSSGTRTQDSPPWPEDPQDLQRALASALSQMGIPESSLEDIQSETLRSASAVAHMA